MSVDKQTKTAYLKTKDETINKDFPAKTSKYSVSDVVLENINGVEIRSSSLSENPFIRADHAIVREQA